MWGPMGVSCGSGSRLVPGAGACRALRGVRGYDWVGCTGRGEARGSRELCGLECSVTMVVQP